MDECTGILQQLLHFQIIMMQHLTSFVNRTFRDDLGTMYVALMYDFRGGPALNIKIHSISLC